VVCSANQHVSTVTADNVVVTCPPQKRIVAVATGKSIVAEIYDRVFTSATKSS